MSITATFAGGSGITASFGNAVVQAASQAEVDTGTNTSKFVNPLTFTGASKWDTKINHALSTAANDFLVGSGSNTFIKKTLAETAEILKAYITDSTIQTLTDGASITVDHDSWGGRIFFLSTAQSTPTFEIEDFGKGGHISVKKTISGDTTVTIQGTGYKFVNMDTKALPAASVDITLSDTINFGFEINLMNAGYTSGGDAVINVKKQ